MNAYSEVCKNTQKKAELSKPPLTSHCLLAHPFSCDHADIFQPGTPM